jgi:hypothetical protein
MMQLPTLEQAYVIAPLVTLILSIVSLGFVAGYYSRKDHIETLKSWIDSLGRKK